VRNERQLQRQRSVRRVRGRHELRHRVLQRLHPHARAELRRPVVVRDAFGPALPQRLRMRGAPQHDVPYELHDGFPLRLDALLRHLRRRRVVPAQEDQRWHLRRQQSVLERLLRLRRVLQHRLLGLAGLFGRQRTSADLLHGHVHARDDELLAVRLLGRRLPDELLDRRALRLDALLRARNWCRTVPAEARRRSGLHGQQPVHVEQLPPVTLRYRWQWHRE
jgi:hypothetical protein